jgi:hypothetical protein
MNTMESKLSSGDTNVEEKNKEERITAKINASVATFEGNVLMLMQEFKEAHDEYSANISDPTVNTNGQNSDYFRGKADAYGYAARMIKQCLRWHGKLEY